MRDTKFHTAVYGIIDMLIKILKLYSRIWLNYLGMVRSLNDTLLKLKWKTAASATRLIISLKLIKSFWAFGKNFHEWCAFSVWLVASDITVHGPMWAGETSSFEALSWAHPHGFWWFPFMHLISMVLIWTLKPSNSYPMLYALPTDTFLWELDALHF